MRSVSVRRPDELDAATAYALWRLRQDVFVVEQACPYADLDGRDLDPATRHVLLHDDGTLVGCARLLEDDGRWRVGRVALARSARGVGAADALVRAAVGAAVAVDADRAVVLDAQSPLVGWYSRLGFEVDGEEFLEDGIAHRPMRLRRDG